MRINNSFLLGLTAGACLGYYLASSDEEREELVESVKSNANKMKDMVGEGIERGKKVVANIKERVNGE